MISWKNRKGGGREISPEMQKVLATEFHLESEVTARLQFAQKKGKYAGRSVRHICIFDPTVVLDQEGSAITFDEVVKQQVGVLFIGYIEKDGTIFLASKRAA